MMVLQQISVGRSDSAALWEETRLAVVQQLAHQFDLQLSEMPAAALVL